MLVGHLKTAYKTQKLNSEVSPHRAVSAVRLMRIELGGAFADLLNEKGKGSGDNEMGYVKRTLGYIGSTYLYLDTFLQILRIGFYEIMKLEIPPYDENARLAKVALRPGAGNMVNRILRKLVSLKPFYLLDHLENDSLPLPKLEGDDRAQARVLATLYSHPVWMVRRWTKYLGCEEAIQLMTWNNSDPSFSLRHGITVERFHKSRSCVVTYNVEECHTAGLLKEGFCSVQDESAVSVLDPQPGKNIVDCCAAPGGKTPFYGIPSEWPRADLRWNRRLEDMEELKVLQDELFDVASMLVNPSGVLVYSTCSIDPEENEERVAAFLLRRPEFSIDSADGYAPPDFVMERGFYFSSPVKHSLDGVFAARLVRS
ncbi:hypothetical protein LguiB_026916 [Lonicera macranthoides]